MTPVNPACCRDTPVIPGAPLGRCGVLCGQPAVTTDDDMGETE